MLWGRKTCCTQVSLLQYNHAGSHAPTHRWPHWCRSAASLDCIRVLSCKGNRDVGWVNLSKHWSLMHLLSVGLEIDGWTCLWVPRRHRSVVALYKRSTNFYLQPRNLNAMLPLSKVVFLFVGKVCNLFRCLLNGILHNRIRSALWVKPESLRSEFSWPTNRTLISSFRCEVGVILLPSLCSQARALCGLSQD